MAQRSLLRLRSARCQWACWEDGELRIVNCLTREAFAANPITLDLLRFFSAPRTIRDAIFEFGPYSPESIGQAIVELIEAGLLLDCASSEAERDERLHSSWKPWLPEGGYHFLTKDAPYARGNRTPEQARAMLPGTPQPAHFKTIAGSAPISLPPYTRGGDSFFQTLHRRRTHRRFSARPVTLESVAKLLHATWGVQGYIDTESFGPLPLKTSPSGGARHPIEVYLMALRVSGLARGLYHYDGKGHALERISRRATPQRARAFCADQPHAADAAALFVMTAVFARAMWKYPHPRAYRVVLLDAGHLGQTFCLTATRLGLAPFSTAALADTLIERDLGIDGISESVIYVTGVGEPARVRPLPRAGA